MGGILYKKQITIAEIINYLYRTFIDDMIYFICYNKIDSDNEMDKKTKFEHDHTHTHNPQDMKAIVNRLARSIGHLEAVKRMVENNSDCPDVLIQIAAVRAELNNAGKLLLKEHLEHCIVEAISENDQEALNRMNEAIDRFIK